jgi:hypothetical protein
VTASFIDVAFRREEAIGRLIDLRIRPQDVRGSRSVEPPIAPSVIARLLLPTRSRSFLRSLELIHIILGVGLSVRAYLLAQDISVVVGRAVVKLHPEWLIRKKVVN